MSGACLVTNECCSNIAITMDTAVIIASYTGRKKGLNPTFNNVAGQTKLLDAYGRMCYAFLGGIVQFSVEIKPAMCPHCAERRLVRYARTDLAGGLLGFVRGE